MTTNTDNRAAGLETVSGEIIGRDPRRMTTAELNSLGHTSKSVLAAVRAKCLDCCCYEPTEVRKCVATSCPLWPLRTGVNPLARRDISQEQRDAMRARAAAARAARSMT